MAIAIKMKYIFLIVVCFLGVPGTQFVVVIIIEMNVYRFSQSLLILDQTDVLSTVSP